MAANKIPQPKALNGFVLSKISAITVTGTKNNQSEILKVLSILLSKALTSVEPEVSILELIIPKTTKVTIIVGTVVIVI